MNLNVAILHYCRCFFGKYFIKKLIDFMKGHWELLTKILNLVLKIFYWYDININLAFCVFTWEWTAPLRPFWYFLLKAGSLQSTSVSKCTGCRNVTNILSTEFMWDMIEEIDIRYYTRSIKKLDINKNDETHKHA